MAFSRQEYWGELPFPSPGDLPDPGMEPTSPVSSAWKANSLPLRHPGSPIHSPMAVQKEEYQRISEVCFFFKKKIIFNWGKTALQPVLVSAVQQCKSAISTYVSPPS